MCVCRKVIQEEVYELLVNYGKQQQNSGTFKHLCGLESRPMIRFLMEVFENPDHSD